MTERAIIDLCIKGDRKGQRTLYENYSGQMYSICLRYCQDSGIAADALQNGFISIFKNIASFKGEGNLKAWIRKIMVRSSLDQIRKRKRHSFVELNTAISEGSYNIDQELQLESYDVDRMLNLLEELPQGYKLIFSMHVLDDMSHKEISQSLNISESTSRSQLLRARKMLQNLVTKDVYLSKNYSVQIKKYSA